MLGRRDVLIFMSNHPNAWFTIRDISTSLDIARTTANRHLMNLYTNGNLEIYQNLSNHRYTAYRFKKLDNE